MTPSHPQPARLTKKQKKATAFRERGSGKLKGKGKQQPTNPAPGRSRPPHTSGDNNGEDADDYDDYDDDEANAVPAMEDEDQALAERAGDTEGDAKGDAKGRATRVPKPKIAVESTAPQNKNKNKRRRTEEDGEAQPGAATRKKARLARGSKEVLPPGEGDGAASLNAVTDGDGSKANIKESKTQRYILFIGNLKYTTTREAIQNHFSLCDPPPTVRLLTPKVTRAGATTVAKSKSKGCAFLEFTTRPALQAALRLHQSELDGRRINVELTAGGGGKSNARLEKVKARNKLLAAQRTRRTAKGATAQGKDAVQHEHPQPQRFSTTSGEGDVPRTKRTWTVGDEDQGGERHGRTKTGKKRGTRTKNWGTGVNALPIG